MSLTSRTINPLQHKSHQPTTVGSGHPPESPGHPPGPPPWSLESARRPRPLTLHAAPDRPSPPYLAACAAPLYPYSSCAGAIPCGFCATPSPLLQLGRRRPSPAARRRRLCPSPAAPCSYTSRPTTACPALLIASSCGTAHMLRGPFIVLLALPRSLCLTEVRRAGLWPPLSAAAGLPCVQLLGSLATLL